MLYNRNMLGKTHIAAGIAASALVLRPTTPGDCMLCVLGSTVGAVLCDLEIRSRKHRVQRALSRIVVLLLCVCVIVSDRMLHTGLADQFIQQFGLPAMAGVVVFFLLCIPSRRSAHRSYSHSLLSMVLFCASVYLISPPLMPYFAVGFASHIVLDLMNFQPLRLFFPLRGKISLGLCAADKKGDKLMFALACTCIAFYLVYLLLLIGE